MFWELTGENILRKKEVFILVDSAPGLRTRGKEMEASRKHGGAAAGRSQCSVHTEVK